MASDTTGQNSLVQRLHDEVAALTRATALPQTDEAMTTRLDQLFGAACRLAQAPAVTATDLDLKLAVLCRRLREHLDPDDRGAVLTYLLAEAVRDEHSLLAEPSAGEPNTR